MLNQRYVIGTMWIFSSWHFTNDYNRIFYRNAAYTWLATQIVELKFWHLLSADTFLHYIFFCEGNFIKLNYYIYLWILDCLFNHSYQLHFIIHYFNATEGLNILTLINCNWICPKCLYVKPIWMISFLGIFCKIIQNPLSWIPYASWRSLIIHLYV